jgi:hypothetical protein
VRARKFRGRRDDEDDPDHAPEAEREAGHVCAPPPRLSSRLAMTLTPSISN